MGTLSSDTRKKEQQLRLQNPYARVSGLLGHNFWQTWAHTVTNMPEVLFTAETEHRPAPWPCGSDWDLMIAIVFCEIHKGLTANLPVSIAYMDGRIQQCFPSKEHKISIFILQECFPTSQPRGCTPNVSSSQVPTCSEAAQYLEPWAHVSSLRWWQHTWPRVYEGLITSTTEVCGEDKAGLSSSHEMTWERRKRCLDL